ncbi:MAG: hypothetical protein BWZ11_01278 [Bacteroidetes bacterium ADurb.BinA395]|nr:MAG: hypothetical protein BWZ11_01278 [Bacteroidetes bacterium ADurb.BinA395]
MFGKSVVSAVVRRNSHNSPCSVTGKHIIGNPNGNFFPGNRMNGIRTGKNSRNTPICQAFTFCTLFGVLEVFFNFSCLLGSGTYFYQFAFRSKYHKCNAKYGIRTCGKYFKSFFSAFYGKTDFGTFTSSYPIPLCFFQGVGPVDSFQTIQQTLGISRNAQTPLPHDTLLYRISTANGNAFAHFVVGQHRTQSRTPVHFCVGQIGNAIV